MSVCLSVHTTLVYRRLSICPSFVSLFVCLSPVCLLVSLSVCLSVGMLISNMMHFSQLGQSCCEMCRCASMTLYIHYPLLHFLKVDHLFLSHHEMLKDLLVEMLNESQNPRLVEQIFILILNVGSGTHRSILIAPADVWSRSVP